jgi:CelD/BcsL family acetyltransferase involved in cellulose biosynthesis
VRQGVMVHWVHAASFLPTYARLLASTWQERQGLKHTTPFAFYARLFKQRDSLKLRVMAATYRGRVIAAIWLLHCNGQCCYWDGASEQAHRSLSATHLLQWEAFRWCLKNKIHVYDMGGGAITHREGLIRFKRSFGANPVKHSVLYWQTTSMRLALTGYRWVALLRYRLKLRGLPAQRRSESDADKVVMASNDE